MEITLNQFKIRIDSLGYRFEKYPSMSLETTSCGNRGWCVPPICEKDSGISAAHYKDARRDENYRTLQELRTKCEVRHRGYDGWC